ncbi:ferredoxin family protein [Candidatus Woesearchaeota archaeon]|nr:ferredoxin family protein [Candidatus Woesearchaeota archaeon]
MPKPIIDYSKCSTCKTCVEVCPMEVFAVEEVDGREKVVVKKPDECIGCRACEVQCPEQAIKVED